LCHSNLNFDRLEFLEKQLLRTLKNLLELFTIQLSNKIRQKIFQIFAPNIDIDGGIVNVSLQPLNSHKVTANIYFFTFCNCWFLPTNFNSFLTLVILTESILLQNWHYFKIRGKWTYINRNCQFAFFDQKLYEIMKLLFTEKFFFNIALNRSFSTPKSFAFVYIQIDCILDAIRFSFFTSNATICLCHMGSLQKRFQLGLTKFLITNWSFKFKLLSLIIMKFTAGKTESF
jgi:hypothetical protein